MPYQGFLTWSLRPTLDWFGKINLSRANSAMKSAGVKRRILKNGFAIEVSRSFTCRSNITSRAKGTCCAAASLWFAGYHIRSDMMAHQKVAEIVDQEILSLELTNGWFYHLDTCFCPLSDKMRYSILPPLTITLEVFEKHIPDLIPVRRRRRSALLVTPWSRTEISS